MDFLNFSEKRNSKSICAVIFPNKTLLIILNSASVINKCLLRPIFPAKKFKFKR